MSPSPSSVRNWVGWLVMALVVVGALAVGIGGSGGARTPSQRIDAIAKTIKCPQCRTESVYESRVASAENVRNEIARQVAAGRTDDEVRAYIAARFGEDLLLTPSTRGLASVVWVLPVVVLVLAFAGLAAAFARWRALERDAADVTDADRLLVAAAMAAEETPVGAVDTLVSPAADTGVSTPLDTAVSRTGDTAGDTAGDVAVSTAGDTAGDVAVSTAGDTVGDVAVSTAADTAGAAQGEPT